MPRLLRAAVRILSATVLLVTIVRAGTATASSSADLPRIALHPTTNVFKNPCGYRPFTEGMAVNVSLPYDARYVFLVICNGPALGIAGLELGIDYPGDYYPSGDMRDPSASAVAVFGWSLCATLDFPQAEWPAPNSGNLIAWNNDTLCQVTPDAGGGVMAVAGYFYVSAYRPGTMWVIPRPVTGRAKVADCTAAEIDITDANSGGLLGRAGFGNNEGYNPCAAAVVPVVGSTWSAIKTMR